MSDVKEIRRIVREELKRLGLKSRVTKPCAWPPQCMGAAARGPEYCTCAGRTR